ncbi:hypothetical protein [Herbidospora cretacea]|uniref:hypothetical protein n=1 Tax=Herbidospora cretacea TaxID=28444 RepID=UPI0034E2B0A9
MTYAVGIDPHKLPRVIALLRRGVTLRVLLDSREQAAFVADASREAGLVVPAQIEIDCDGHRGGLGADAPGLVAQHRGYHVIDSARPTDAAPAVQAHWERITGW